jgi:hypothetical protein
VARGDKQQQRCCQYAGFLLQVIQIDQLIQLMADTGYAIYTDFNNIQHPPAHQK